MGGGQESTVMSSLSVLAHHGIIFVPLGYSRTFPQLTNMTEVHGGELCRSTVLFSMLEILTTAMLGSPWGAGTFAGTDGSRQPSALELETASIQGQYFYELVARAFH